jgi:chorismate lyase/3-hydroxybenzoate synthase
MHYSHPPTVVGLGALTPRPPAWLGRLVGAARADAIRPQQDLAVSVATGAHFTHVHVELANADSMPSDALADRVREAYLLVAATLTEQRRHPVRFWNFVPNIHTPSGEGIDRYMVFNSGRFAACERWLGSAKEFDHTLAAASGVGVVGTDLGIHCLAADSPGRPVENPRQVPAYRYSQRFGPRPPCFARATRITRQIDAAWWLLVAGTASIRGEATAFVSDVAAQTAETFANLDALLEASERAHVADQSATRAAGDAHFTSLRVYVVHDDDLAIVQQLVSARYPDVLDVEYARADLCRTDLLVEIEGVAEL